MPRPREEVATMAAVPHSARMLPHIRARPGVNSGRSLHGRRPHSGHGQQHALKDTINIVQLCIQVISSQISAH